MNSRHLIEVLILSALLATDQSEAVIYLETDDPLHHATTPGDNSGWQYEGRFSSFLGVPIAPHFFITAKHIGGTVGAVFDFHGDSYITIAVHHSPTTDLSIWEVEHAKPFSTYAPLSTGVADLGATAAIFGRGSRRGVEVIVSGESKGWKWGAGDGVKRWGKNTVAGTYPGGTAYGELLYCDFDHPGLDDECHLSVGDSGGGMFVLEAGLWRLAAIHLGVDGPFRLNSMETGYNAALFDVGGLEVYDGTSWIPLANEEENLASSFYSSRISASQAWITSIAAGAGTIPDESYSAWQKLYFTPGQIADPAATGPLADFDGDGIANLLEFALNLDPIFNERAIMTTGSGLRGLPLVHLENIAGADRLTIEFVRRTGSSGSGLTFVPEFSSDLDGAWEQVGTETVTSLNPRWERVKIVDSLTADNTGTRYARLRVSLVE